MAMLPIAPTMRRAALIALAAPLVLAAPAAAGRVITFPCMKNLDDGRVLVDGDRWDEKMRQLGYELEDGAYVPWKVLGFRKEKLQDESWAEGTCRLELLPVEK